MPRGPRIDHPGLLHHIIVRGIERRKIFLEKSDYEDFLTRLEIGLEKSGGQCLAWALMPNHAHLLIRSGKRGIAPLMRRVLTGYAIAFNYRRRRSGHLFQNRYKSTICQEDAYLLELVRYIHLNPLRAKIVRSMEELGKYPWTGHAVLMGEKNVKWQETGEVLRLFGKDSKRNYEKFVIDGWLKGKKQDYSGGGLIRSLGGLANALAIKKDERQLYDERILGDGAFVESVLKTEEQLCNRKKITLDDLLDFVSEKTGVEKKELIRRNRQRTVSKGKAVLISLGIDCLNKTGREMAMLTKMSTGAVSQALQRGREFVDKKGWANAINN